VLAGNVANLDTPGYRVRDISPEKFPSRVEGARPERDQPDRTYGARSSPPDRDPVQDVGTDLAGMLYHDESNDSIERQVLAITENQTLHNLTLSILNSQFRLLKAAASEQA
jgi:flagellar basal-body rod protein FlgB